MDPSREERRRFLAVVSCVAGAAFNFQLDAYMVSVCLPVLATDLQSSTTEVSFVMLAYLAAGTTALTFAGQGGRRWGLKRTFLGGSLVFALGTSLCAGAGSILTLSLFRALQGLGVGMLAALGYALIPVHLPPRQVGQGFGALSLAAGLGMMAGAPLGGILAQFLSWRWVFGINGILQVLLLGAAWRLLPPDPEGERDEGAFDVPGILLFAGTVLAALLTNGFAASWGGWGSPRSLLGVGLVLALGTALGWRSAHSPAPLATRAVLAVPGFLPGVMSQFFLAGALGGLLFLLPFALEFLLGLSHAAAGGILLLYPAVFAPVAALAGRAADRGNPARTALLGALGFAVLLGLGTFLPGSPVPFWPLLPLLGAALGFCIPSTNKAALSRVPRHERAQAAPLLPLALNLGTVGGISLADALLTRGFPGGTATLPEAGRGLTASARDLLTRGVREAWIGLAFLALAATLLAREALRQHRTAHPSSDPEGGPSHAHHPV